MQNLLLLVIAYLDNKIPNNLRSYNIKGVGVYMHYTAGYHIYPKCLDRQACANSVDPDQMPQNVASDQGLHCFSLLQQLFGHVNWYFNRLVQVLEQVW